MTGCLTDDECRWRALAMRHTRPDDPVPSVGLDIVEMRNVIGHLQQQIDDLKAASTVKENA